MIKCIVSFSDYQMILYSWMAIGLITFFYLLKVTAPYGRHTSAKWGPLIDNRLGWIIMELPVLVIFVYFITYSSTKQNLASWIIIACFCFHYINRVFIYPFRLRTKGKKMPVVIMVSAVLFNLINGFSLGYFFAFFQSYNTAWIYDARFLIGLAIFFAGIIINWKSDNILIHLRKPGETGYKIPYKWLFEYISCPNLFGELLEWFGFAVLCWNLPAAVFFIWTAANLIPRALSHHQWYKLKFSEYPVIRKAIIPFMV